jgi:hypothetical protein
MIDPIKGKMEANADRAREKMEKREQRLENRAMLSETRPADPPGIEAPRPRGEPAGAEMHPMRRDSCPSRRTWPAQGRPHG